MEKSPWLHAGPLLLPFVALLLSRLVTSAFTVDFDVLYPARVVLVSLVLFKCWPQARLGPPTAHAWLAGMGVYALWTVQELAFRGYLLRRLQSRHFDQVPPGRLTVASALLSSLAFGALHSAWLAGSLAGLALRLGRE